MNSVENFELYDLVNDKNEKQNIIYENELIAKKMKRDLKKWQLSVEHSKKGGDYK